MTLLANMPDSVSPKISDNLELENAQLKSTIKELEQFVHTVSHDLKAPLSSLIGLVRLAMHPDTDEVVLRQYLQLINKSVVQLDTFLQDLINYSRNIRMEISATVVDVRVLVEDIFQNLNHLLEAENVRLEIDSEPLEIYTDYMRLKMVLNNLIANAIFYSSKQQDPYVKVAFEKTRNGLFVRVMDNGIGIDPQHREKIFDMFYRVSSEGTGSGLGLHIVKEAVDRLDGEIEVDSEIGKGSVFKVFIPLPESEV